MTASSETVRAQYEALPYPARDPAEEAQRLIVGSPSHLAEIDHYLLAGRLHADWVRPQQQGRQRRFKVLVAGGGTGDATVMLAQQAADAGLGVDILQLDLSEASLAIAAARIAARGLTGVTFRRGSLLERQTEAPFDYIDCCGVLHHLPDPAAGLAALARQLAPGGGMGIMVYGALGRRGVYDVQALLQLLLPDGGDAGTQGTDARLAEARQVLAALPPSNWLLRNPFVTDHRQGDAGFWDLLLHSIDRAYTVPELLAQVSGAGLAPVVMIEPVLYAPETHITDRTLHPRLAALSAPQRWAAAELAFGGHAKHIVYLRQGTGLALAPPAADDPAVIPVPRGLDPVALGRTLRDGGRPAFTAGILKLTPALGPDHGRVLMLCDGQRSLAGIVTELQRSLGRHWDEARVLALFQPLFKELSGLNLLLLRQP